MTCIADIVSKDLKILFGELEPWEQDELRAICPGKCNLEFSDKRLEEMDDTSLTPDVTIFSPFVHSSVTAERIDRMPALKLIATRSTGFDHIDVEACNERGILIANVPHYGEDTVAEHAFAMLLALTRKIHRCYERTSRGDFNIEGLRGIDLAGKTFGCLGVGNIGAKAMRIAGGFAMNRIACDMYPDPLLSGTLGFRYVDFDTLLAEADVLSLHLPLNDATRHIINAEALGKMKPDAMIVNTARGGIIDAAALVAALNNGKLGGAALDVLEAEEAVAEEAELLSHSYDIEMLRKIVQSNALLKMPNVIITPHNAFNSIEACQRIIRTTMDNIHAYLQGEPANIVNK